MGGPVMSRKHNVAKQRSASNYPARLQRRGESSVSVRMADYIRCGIGSSPTAASRQLIADAKAGRSPGEHARDVSYGMLRPEGRPNLSLSELNKGEIK